MPKQVTVSILMAVYNTEFCYLKRAIDSVLQQDFQDFELIIIDDGSRSSNSVSLMQYAHEFEDKIIYIRHSNRGQSESINRGVLISHGDFITIIDGDDEYKPDHLSACLKTLGTSDLICSKADIIVDSMEDYYVPDKNDLTKSIHLDDVTLFGTLFGRKKVFTSLYFNTGFAADSDFFERAELQFQVKRVNLRTYIYYRNIPNSICSVIKKQHLITVE